MPKFINGRWVSDAELYPEQFEELPDEVLPKKRDRAVKLADMEPEGGERCGKSPQNHTSGDKKTELGIGEDKKKLLSLLGGTAPTWKQSTSFKDAVNPHKKTSEEDGGAETVERICGGKRRATAKAYALKAVAASTLTERKLREKLKAKEYSEEETDEAIEYVKSFGYINDDRLAQNMLDKLAARCWGRIKICHYLKGKGITEAVIENLDFSEIDFPYYCAQLMKKYSPERREAMLRAVKNAGYSSDDIRAARTVLAEEN